MSNLFLKSLRKTGYAVAALAFVYLLVPERAGTAGGMHRLAASAEGRSSADWKPVRLHQVSTGRLAPQSVSPSADALLLNPFDNSDRSTSRSFAPPRAQSSYSPPPGQRPSQEPTDTSPLLEADTADETILLNQGRRGWLRERVMAMDADAVADEQLMAIEGRGESLFGTEDEDGSLFASPGESFFPSPGSLLGEEERTEEDLFGTPAAEKGPEAGFGTGIELFTPGSDRQ
jgi:hypothetical protein